MLDRRTAAAVGRTGEDQAGRWRDPAETGGGRREDRGATGESPGGDGRAGREGAVRGRAGAGRRYARGHAAGCTAYVCGRVQGLAGPSGCCKRSGPKRGAHPEGSRVHGQGDSQEP